MTAFRIAVWIALALGGFGIGGFGIGGVVQPKAGCCMDPDGRPCAAKSTGEVVWADGAHDAPSGSATADAGSGIDPLGGF